MIEVESLTKTYGGKTAVNGISFKAEEGEILGFLGPNGAGKSTTMNMLTGYISCTAGRALINGIDILERPIEAKRNIGYLPEHPPLYLDMTVDEYLKFVYDLKKSRLPKAPHLAEICELVKITDVRGRIIKNLSKGYRQRVGLAQALIGNPKVLILDEPTVGLDPKQIIEIRNLIKRLGKKHTMILSSHILPEIQAVCDKIVIINKGVIVANDSTSKLSANLSGDRKIQLQAEGAEEDVKRVLESIHGVERIWTVKKIEDGKPPVFEYLIEPKSDIRRDVSKKLAVHNFPLLMMRTNDLSLEEIFLKLTTGDSAAQPDDDDSGTDGEDLFTNDTVNNTADTENNEIEEA